MVDSTRIIKPGLKRISNLLKLLGNPHLDYPSIQIAGTNGKGSTAHFLNNILIESGLRVGLFTSPHILKPEERITISNEKIKDDVHAKIDIIKDIYINNKAYYDGDEPTYFELMSALAMQYFSKMRVDIAILETGLGGRLDSTTAAQSIGFVLTDVSIDHVNFLGYSEEEILYEKVSAANKGFFVSSRIAHNLRRIPDLLLKSKMQSYYLHRDFFFQVVGDNCFDFISRNVTVKKLKKVSRGDFQYINASLAIMAAIETMDLLSIGKNRLIRNIRKGIENTNMPGRFQKMSVKPEVILDVGHNPCASRTIRDELRLTGRRSESACIFTMARGKDPADFLYHLKETIDYFIYFQEGDTFFSKKELVQLLNVGNYKLTFTMNFSEALILAKALVSDEGLILLSGSFALAQNYLRIVKTDEI